MTKATTILASLALVAAVACSKDDSKKKTDNANKKTTAAKTENKVDTKKAEKKAEPKKTETADASKIKSVTPDELEKELSKTAVLDANNPMTRKKYGKIPGAILLTSSSDYKMDELPKDKTKPLVFYCSNTYCGASKKGAKRALLAGYSDVSVLPVGVKGWKEAGKKTETVQ